MILEQINVEFVQFKESKMAKKSGGTVKGKVGSTFTKTISKGPNNGDKVQFKVAPSKKPYPVKVLVDVGGNSTLKNNPGVKFGKGKSKK